MYAPHDLGANNPPAHLYFCDSAIDPHYRGVAVAVARRAPNGQILETACRVLPWMTNNEAEYEAFILGLELALARRDAAPIFLLDSQIVVGQGAGTFAVRDPRLAARHARATRLLAQLPEATVIFVPRERNLLADALAKEALAEGLGR